jgi:hypothetical protein
MPRTPPPSFEADLAVFIQLQEQETDALWAQAAWAAEMAARWGRHTARWVAAGAGVSAGYVRQLIATAQAFPTPADRAADLTFSHHRLAALTDDPAGWLQAAVDHQWSARELGRAIRAARDPYAEAEAARRAAEAVERAAAQYNARWAAATGRRAVLTWVTAARTAS